MHLAKPLVASLVILNPHTIACLFIITPVTPDFVPLAWCAVAKLMPVHLFATRFG